MLTREVFKQKIVRTDDLQCIVKMIEALAGINIRQDKNKD